MTLYDEELLKVQECCKKYGYKAFLRFDEIHIRTVYESWFFVPNTQGTMKLMHGNTMGLGCEHWHKQFVRAHMEYEDLIQYIHEHEAAKYKNAHIQFTFSKYGTRRTAVC